MKINKEQYDVIYTKAQSLKESALILAETKSYNEAISLLILSMEELIKYMVIMQSETASFPLDEKIKKQMFREHPPKHNFIKEYFDSFSDECISDFLFHLVISGYSFFDAVKNAGNPFAVWSFAFRLFKGTWQLTQDQKRDFDNWISQINALKKNGFYADLQNGKIISIEKNESDFQQAYSFASMFFKQAEFMKSVDTFNNDLYE